jgi:two-component system nitrate/nitrite response regulator NarL
MPHKRPLDWTTTEPVNIILIDSQRLFREALHSILETPPLVVVAQGSSPDEALANLPADTSLHLAVCSFASDAEAESQLGNIRSLRERYPNLKSVILTDCQQASVLLKAVRIGVEAFLSRNVSVDVLCRTLELVMLGQYLLPTSLAQLLLDPLQAMPADISPSARELLPLPPVLPDQRRTTTLTPRECEILQCITDGRSNKEIARRLNLTEATVKAHVKALLRKTQMTNRTQAAIWAVSQTMAPGEAVAATARLHPQAASKLPLQHAVMAARKATDMA